MTTPATAVTETTTAPLHLDGGIVLAVRQRGLHHSQALVKHELRRPAMAGKHLALRDRRVQTDRNVLCRLITSEHHTAHRQHPDTQEHVHRLITVNGPPMPPRPTCRTEPRSPNSSSKPHGSHQRLPTFGWIRTTPVPRSPRPPSKPASTSTSCPAQKPPADSKSDRDAGSSNPTDGWINYCRRLDRHCDVALATHQCFLIFNQIALLRRRLDRGQSFHSLGFEGHIAWAQAMP